MDGVTTNPVPPPTTPAVRLLYLRSGLSVPSLLLDSSSSSEPITASLALSSRPLSSSRSLWLFAPSFWSSPCSFLRAFRTFRAWAAFFRPPPLPLFASYLFLYLFDVFPFLLPPRSITERLHP